MANDPVHGAQFTRPRLPDAMRNAIRVKHYGPRKEETNARRVRRYVLFHGNGHPGERKVSFLRGAPIASIGKPAGR